MTIKDESLLKVSSTNPSLKCDLFGDTLFKEVLKENWGHISGPWFNVMSVFVERDEGWGYRSVVESLLSVRKVLGPIPAFAKS